MKKSLLSHDLILQALFDANRTVTERFHSLNDARRARDELIMQAKEAQIPQSRISRAAGVAPGNLADVYRKVEERRAGLRD